MFDSLFRCSRFFRANTIAGLWLLLFCGFNNAANAQQIDSLSLDTLMDAQIRLDGMGTNMITSYDETTRMLNARNFLITLSRALRVKNSYYFRFDSLKCASIQYAPDDFFRIITWNVVLNNETFHYFGVIQLNPEKMKKIKDTTNLRSVYPLIDRSAQIDNPMDSILSQGRWYGMNYYKIIPVTDKNKTYYTLLGWNGGDVTLNRKAIDVLHFEQNKPVFGAPIFDMKDIRFKKKLSRVVFEFNNNAVMTLRYIEAKKILVYENLVPPRPQDYGHPETYLPDGSYEYFMFKNGNWEKQPKGLKEFELE